MVDLGSWGKFLGWRGVAEMHLLEIWAKQNGGNTALLKAFYIGGVRGLFNGKRNCPISIPIDERCHSMYTLSCTSVVQSTRS